MRFLYKLKPSRVKAGNMPVVLIRYGHCSEGNILVLNVVANFYTDFYNLDKLSSFCSILSN